MIGGVAESAPSHVVIHPIKAVKQRVPIKMEDRIELFAMRIELFLLLWIHFPPGVELCTSPRHQRKW